MNILCIGEILCDVVMKTIDPSDFEKGRAVLDDFQVHGGGDGNNASLDLAKLGETVRPFSIVGNDFLGNRVLSLLREAGIDTRYVITRDDAKTTVSVLMLGSDGDVTAGAFRLGCSRSCTAEDIPAEAFEWADHVHLVSAMSYPLMDGEGTGRLMRLAKEHGCTTSMDTNLAKDREPGMYLVEKALENTDLFMPSYYEIELLSGLKDPHEIAMSLKDSGVKVFVMKLGEKGVFVTDFKEEFIQPSLYKGTPVDVVGAGDAFSSTFATAWKKGYDIRSCAAIASSASANVISMVGTTAGMKSFDELIRYAEGCGCSLVKGAER